MQFGISAEESKRIDELMKEKLRLEKVLEQMAKELRRLIYKIEKK